MQGCEVGIPLAYLAGLDSCYKSFLSLMRSAGSEVLCINWQDFGNSHAVATEIAAAQTVALPDPAAVAALVYNESAVRARMHLLAGRPAGIDEADAEVIDDSTDATVEESYATPTKQLHSADRSAVSRTPDTPAAKVAKKGTRRTAAEEAAHGGVSSAPKLAIDLSATEGVSVLAAECAPATATTAGETA